MTKVDEKRASASLGHEERLALPLHYLFGAIPLSSRK